MRRFEFDPTQIRRPVDTTKKPPPYPYRVHRQIRHTAKEFAGAFFEGAQFYFEALSVSDKEFAQDRSKEFRKHWRSVDDYIAWCWPLFVKDARKHLTELLGRQGVSEHLKESIYEAVVAEYDAFAFTPEFWRERRAG